MATMTIFVDDIDGNTEDVETIEFAIDGVSYTIDLGPDNAEQLREALATYIEHGQRIGGPARGTRKRRVADAPVAPVTAVAAEPGGKADLSEVREWARENGYGVSDRGRIAQSVRDAFEAAR